MNLSKESSAPQKHKKRVLIISSFLLAYLVIVISNVLFLKFITGNLWTQNQRLMTQLRDQYSANEEFKSKNTELNSKLQSIETTQSSYRGELMQEKTYKDVVFKAYSLDTQETFATPSFIIENGERPVVLSSFVRDLGSSEYFDFYHSKMLVSNMLGLLSMCTTWWI